MSTPENPPAFLRAITVSVQGDVYESQDGMTLRDYFAGQALAGMTIRMNNQPDPTRADGAATTPFAGTFPATKQPFCSTEPASAAAPVSAEAREAAQIYHGEKPCEDWLLEKTDTVDGMAEFIQRAIDRATEKLMEELSVLKLSHRRLQEEFDKQNSFLSEARRRRREEVDRLHAERDQLRAELQAAKKQLEITTQSERSLYNHLCVIQHELNESDIVTGTILSGVQELKKVAMCNADACKMAEMELDTAKARLASADAENEALRKDRERITIASSFAYGVLSIVQTTRQFNIDGVNEALKRLDAAMAKGEAK